MNTEYLILSAAISSTISLWVSLSVLTTLIRSSDKKSRLDAVWVLILLAAAVLSSLGLIAAYAS